MRVLDPLLPEAGGSLAGRPWHRWAYLGLTGVVLFALGYAVHSARATGAPTADPLIYTGYLEQNGAPVTGSHVIEVNLWRSKTSTNTADRACATLPAGSTPVTAGRFRMPLDPTCVQAVHANPDLYAEVVVDGTALPRTKVGAVPYALEAASASQVTGPGSSDVWTTQQSSFLSVASRSDTAIPGLTLSFSLAHPATVTFLSDGTQKTVSKTTCRVFLSLYVDGSPAAGRLNYVDGSSLFDTWSINDSVDLPAGNHTVTVEARSAMSGCMVCGDTNDTTGQGFVASYTGCELIAQAFYH